MTRPYLLYNTTRYLLDAPILIFSFWIVAFYFPGANITSNRSHASIFIILSLISWYSASQGSKLYTDRRSNKFSEEIVYIVFTLILTCIFLTSLFFFFRFYIQFSNFFLANYFIVLGSLLILSKYVFRKYLHSIIYKGNFLDNVLIVGSTPAALDFYETINRYYYYGYKCVGFVDDKQNKLNGCSYLGKINDLDKILLDQDISEVIIALPNSQHREVTACIETCDFHAKRVRIIPDLHLYAASNIQVNNIGLLPVISLRSLPQDRAANQSIKRGFDIVFSLAFFVLAGWWLMALIALCIKLTSKGPVFFKQERWGLNNRKIVCYKFRTMVEGGSDIDEKGKYLQAKKNDARVTKFGQYLRKTNLDELPQFWNVLLGDMSVVGPRPHPTPLNIESIKSVDRYMLRHLVKPGITGLAQVNGCRGETKTSESMQRRVNFDLSYIHQWTFWLDCQIVLQTIINMVRGDQNAY